MKNKFVYIASVALMASGMVFAQAQGYSLASKESEMQIGSAAPTNLNNMLPAVSGVRQTPNAGTSPKGETPGTGVQNGQRGSASPDSSSLPGTGTTGNSGEQERLSKLGGNP